MSDDRYALCFDAGGSALGEVSLRLLRMGVDVIYADSADEALLLACDAAERIHAVIVPPDVGLADVNRVVERIPGPEGKPPAVIVVGDRPADERRAELRGAGVEWAVWSPDDDSVLRFAVNAAMTLPSEIIPRNEPRVPTSLMASFEADGSRANAVAYTLSAKGAFLESPRLVPVGTTIEIELWLPSARVETPAKVIYANAPGEQRRASWPIGMGIVFEQVSEKQEARLRKFIAKQGDSLLV